MGLGNWKETIFLLLVIATGIFGFYWFNFGQSSKPVKNESSVDIRSFSGILFGANEQHIRKKHGSYDRRTTLEGQGNSSLQVYIFEGSSELDFVDQTRFYLHPERGLIRGQYFIRLHQRDDCLDLSRRLISHIEEKTNVSFKGKSKNPIKVPFCDAIQTGDAFAEAIWRNKKTGDRIEIRMGDELGNILTADFLTISFREWNQGLEKISPPQ